MKIKNEIIEQIIQHAKRDLPNEACGYLASKDGVIVKAFEMRNIDNSPEHFSFDPAEQFRVIKEARSEGLTITANYHSHPSTPARPSEEDIRLAHDPDISYMIVSLASTADVRSFKIKDNIVESEEMTILN